MMKVILSDDFKEDFKIKNVTIDSSSKIKLKKIIKK